MVAFARSIATAPAHILFTRTVYNMLLVCVRRFDITGFGVVIFTRIEDIQIFDHPFSRLVQTISNIVRHIALFLVWCDTSFTRVEHFNWVAIRRFPPLPISCPC